TSCYRDWSSDVCSSDLKKNAFFGYNPPDVFFFQQGMMPAFSMNGQLLLGEKDSLALSPDGHGGSLRALDRSGALADMRDRGVEQDRKSVVQGKSVLLSL